MSYLFKNIVILISFLIMFFFGYLPAPEDISSEGMAVLGIGIASMLLWNFVALDWPCILCLAALALFSGLPAKDIFAMGLGSWIVIFLLSCFTIGHALNEEGFTRRLAIIFITNKLIRRNPWYFVLFFLLGAVTMAAVMSPTATFLVFCPIAERVFSEIGYKRKDYLPSLLIISLALAVNIGSSMTPLGHAIPLLAISFYKIATGLNITFLSYSLFGVLIGSVVFIILLLLLKFFFLPDLSRFQDFDAEALRDELLPMNRRELGVLGVFLIVIVMWLTPGVFSLILPGFAIRLKIAGAALPPMLGVVALCVLRVEGRPLLNARDAFQESVPWGILLLNGAILALGTTIIMPQFGLVGALVKGISPVIEGVTPIVLVAILVIWAVAQTNITGNSVTVTLVCSVAMPLMMIGTSDISPQALAALLGVAASMAFATAPIAAPNSVAALSGWWQGDIALKLGGTLAVISIPVIILIGYPLAKMIISVN